MTLEEIVASRAVIVCCGSGGVGKTTTAAALALGAAGLGRRTCVVTIDPARRLADALGLESITDRPRPIPGPWPGTLDAVMLDARGTFDHLVEQYASDVEQAQRIFDNRLYRNLVSALSGTQEYMATEKLFELHSTGRYDLIVVDTPPSRDALDFLAAPKRLTAFLDNRIFRLLLVPGRISLRAMSVASQLLLKTIARVAGHEIVDDTLAFFQAFEGMEGGFRERAAAVESLLGKDATAFVLVVTPQRDTIEEAEFFARRLAESHRGVEALIANRVQPDFGEPAGGDAPRGSAWADHLENLDELAAIAGREESVLAALAERGGAAEIVRVPMLPEDVHDLEGLMRVVRLLLPEPLR